MTLELSLTISKLIAFTAMSLFFITALVLCWRINIIVKRFDALSSLWDWLTVIQKLPKRFLKKKQ